MKKMWFIKFSLCFLLAFTSQAQISKTYNESFNVNENAEIVLNVSGAEIIVETWNKNRVDVEANFSIDLEDEKLAEEILSKVQFEALGNSSKVEIRSRSRNRPLPGIITNKTLGFSNAANGKRLPPPPPLPPLPPLPPSIGEIDIDFDMEKFNEEGKMYIIKFQEDLKEILNDSIFKEELKEWKVIFEKQLRENFNQDSDTIIVGFKRNPRAKAKSYTILGPGKLDKASRKLKKKIIIKMPKDATLTLDAVRSQLKVASLNNINANLNYSGLQVDELYSRNSQIKARYSDVHVVKANGLNLNLNYAKNIHIGEVNNLTSISKTSNLNIELVNEKALIEGSFGDLKIEEISNQFKLIDINLKNSSAKLNLPDIEYAFYINSKSSNIELENLPDYLVDTAFDSKIYQNKKATNSGKVLNIKADYSKFELN